MELDNILKSISCNYYEDLNILVTENRSFSLLGYNINSFSKNFENFKLSYLDGNILLRPNIMAFCETKLYPEIEDIYSIEGYSRVFNSRNGRGGGVMLAMSSGMEFRLVNDLTVSEEYLESLFVEVVLDGVKVLSKDTAWFLIVETDVAEVLCWPCRVEWSLDW